MELLNNLWILLTTSDELYRKIFVIPFAFIETYLAMTLFLIILNIPTNKKNKILYVIFASLITNFNSIFIPSPFNVFLNYILFFILIIVIFKTTILKSFIAIVSSTSILGILGTLILNPYLTILHITTEQLASIPIYNIFYLLTMYGITYFLILIVKSKNFILTFYDDIDKKSKFVIFTNFVFGIVTLIIQTCILFYYVDILPIFITFLSCISLLAYFVISIYSLTRVMKLTLTTRKLQNVEEYNKTLRILHDNVRAFKHDFDNIVTTIGGYIRTNDMEGLENYYLQLEDDCQRVNNLYLLNPEIVNNPRYL